MDAATRCRLAREQGHTPAPRWYYYHEDLFYPLDLYWYLNLLEKGADMRLKNNDQVSASQLALRCKEYEIADMLKVE